jgi:tetratricopeptide (TPR) repeat protein
MSPPESGGLSIWNFLRQVIMGKALAVRLSRLPDHDDYPGFTARVLGTLIVSDLWLKHVNVVLTDKKVSLDSIKVPDEAERAEAAKWEKKGAEATRDGEYQEAVEHYTKAIVTDLTNAMYRCDRSAAQLAQGNYLEAEEDAEIATLLDPKQPKAWSYLGLALMRQGYSRRAEKTYKKALEMVSSDASPAIRQGMDDAQAYSRRTISAINEEQARARRHRLQSDFFAQDYETIGKTVQLHSRVHEQQVEGLLLFAQKLKWPHLNETRAFAEEVYDSVRDSRTINPFLWDWLFGLILPGRWFAYTIMVALLQCTPCIGDKLRDIRYQSSGFALPDRSYWRSRTVLARVLGCLPGVVSLCGWVGPCAAVIFQNQADEGVEQGVQIKARTVTPLGPAPAINTYTYMQVRPGEALSDLHKDLKRVENWVVPSPPSQDDHTCEVQEVQLRRLPPDSNGNDADKRSEYRASVVFRLDSSPTPITYVLYTNPLFVTLPPCQTKDLRQNAGWHDFHKRQLPLYQGKVWSVGELKDYVPEDEHGGHVSTVNATGEGAEVVARAWCSETGRNAAIRRPGGPCLVCAIDAAHSLHIRVLIWVG